LEEIGEMSFAEYRSAFKVWQDLKQAQSREAYEISRLQALLIINMTSTRIKKGFDKPQDLVLFSWEEEAVSKKQSPENMKKAMHKIAAAFGTTDKIEKVNPKPK